MRPRRAGRTASTPPAALKAQAAVPETTDGACRRPRIDNGPAIVMET
jgi:hypothetical protein